MQVDGNRLWNRITELGNIDITEEGGVNRLAFSQADREATDIVMGWMKEVGLKVRTDSVGNVFGLYEGISPGPTILIGSHLDSVPNGGRFDGVAGVIAALEVIQVLKGNDIKPILPIEMVIFVNEEGSRFPGGAMGSRAIAGQLSPSMPFELKDSNGETLADAMTNFGARPDCILEARRLASDFHIFLELHIEQGRLLEELNKPVGIVTGISGTYRMNVRILGRSGHSGTTPMEYRRDPMAVAGIVIIEVERLVKEASNLTRGTIGYIRAHPGSVNVIPSEVEFTIDLRDINPKILHEVAESIKRIIVESCELRELESEIIITEDTQPVPIDTKVIDLLEETARKLKISTVKLPSGAGHDASIMSELCPIGMIFVRSREGLSHCPEEFTSKEDLILGTQLLLDTLLEVSKG